VRRKNFVGITVGRVLSLLFEDVLDTGFLKEESGVVYSNVPTLESTSSICIGLMSVSALVELN
jgi:hypothetical protein